MKTTGFLAGKFVLALVALVLFANTGHATLVAYWPLNDGAAGSAVTGADDLIDDPTHPATDATLSGSGGTWVNDAIRGIVFSTTANDHLDAGTQGITGDFTWSLWVKTTEDSNNVIIGTRDGNPWNKLTTRKLENWAPVNPSTTNWGILDDEWHHMAVRRSGSSVNVYVDGAQNGGTATKVGGFNGPLEIGGASNFSEEITGLMSDVGIWNQALAEWQIEGLANGYYGPANVPVPEPTTLLILSLLAGLGVGLGWRRRK